MARDLERSIRSLLRPGRETGLAPARPRAPIPAAVGVADWTVTLAPLPPYLERWLYSGWLGWGGEDDPLVYTDTALAGYLSGSGTVIPDADPARTEHLQGQVIAAAGGPSWPDAPPSLDGDGAYAWPFEEPTGGSAGCLWTGEAVKMDAALRGSRKSPTTRRTWADVLPPGWSVDSTACGIVWLDGRLWAVRASAAGCDAQELAVPDVLAPVIGWLVDGVGSALDRELWRAWAYAYAKPAAGATVVPLLSAADMVDVYAGGASSLHPQFGWHWLWQSATDDAAGAVMCVTGTADGHYVSRFCGIDLSWADDGPVATLTIGPDQAWGGSGVRVWIPSGNDLEVYRLSAGSSVGTSAVIHVWAPPQGPVWAEVSRTTGGGLVDEGSEPAWPVWCGTGGSAVDTWGGKTTAGEGRVRIDGAVSAVLEYQVFASRSDVVRTVAVAADETITFSEAQQSSSYPRSSASGYMYCENVGYPNAGNCNTHYWYGDIECGHSECQILRYSLGGGSGALALVLLPGAPGVAVRMKQDWSTGTWSDESWQAAPVLSWSGISVGYYDPNDGQYHCPGTPNTPYSHEWNVKLSVGHTSNRVYLSSTDIRSWGYGIRGDVVVSNSAASASGSIMRMVTGRGTLVELDPADWAGLEGTEPISGPWSLVGPRSEAYVGADGPVRPVGMSAWAGPWVAPVGAG